MPGTETAYYLYCLTPAESLPRIDSAGIDDQHPVFAWAFEGIGGVLSEVSPVEFCGEAAEARMQTLAWLGPRVCRHEAVVEQAMVQSPVLPARFATLFTSLDSLRRFALEHRDCIAQFFGELGNKREWAVKGLLDREWKELSVEKHTESVQQPGKGLPGIGYLKKKRIQAEAKEKLGHWLKETCQQAAAELQRHAAGFREQRARKTGDSDEPEVILNWAFLLLPDAESDFEACVGRLHSEYSGQGLDFVLSGPWPPYSFAPALGGSPSP